MITHANKIIIRYLNGLPSIEKAGNTGIHALGVSGLPDEQQLVVVLVTDADNPHGGGDGVRHVATVVALGGRARRGPDGAERLI